MTVRRMGSRGRKRFGVALQVVKSEAPAQQKVILPPPPPPRPWATEDGSLPMIASGLRRVNHPVLLAVVDLYITKWKLTFLECLLFEKDGRYWVRIPSRRWETPAGNIYYTPVVGFDSTEIERAFSNDAVVAISELVERMSSLPPDPGETAPPDPDAIVCGLDDVPF
jgi:hypothetical protein